jgi:hypothetical protein
MTAAPAVGMKLVGKTFVPVPSNWNCVTDPVSVTITVPTPVVVKTNGDAALAEPKPVPTAVPAAMVADPEPTIQNIYVLTGKLTVVCETGAALFSR